MPINLDRSTPGPIVCGTAAVWVAFASIGVLQLTVGPRRPLPAKEQPRVDPIRVVSAGAAPTSPARAVIQPEVVEIPPPPVSVDLQPPTPMTFDLPTPPRPMHPEAVSPPPNRRAQPAPAAGAIAATVKAPGRASAVTPPGPPGPIYQPIRLGVGDGDQPVPEYPAEADTAGQQGTVVVDFSVDSDGHVTDATVARACPWPVLNSAATSWIREHWSYPAGPRRFFQVTFVYRRAED